MKKKCLIVLNPGSGSNKKDAVLKTYLIESLPDFFIEFYVTKGDGDFEFLEKTISRFKPEIVLIGGGDGTIRMVAPLLMHTEMRMGILPLGSANGLAKCLEISDLDNALTIINFGKVIPMDVIKINEEYCLHLADFGFNANLIKNFEEKERRGMVGYLTSSVTEIFKVDPKFFEVIVDGNTVRVESKMVVIANGNRYGTGAEINPGSKLSDGKFEIISINPATVDDHLKMSLALYNGSIKDLPNVTCWQTDHCIIKNVQGAGFQIDGDWIGQLQEIEVSVEHQALHVFVGGVADDATFSNN